MSIKNDIWNVAKDTIRGFVKRVSKSDYEDMILTLLSLAAISYTRNMIANWEHPEIVEFDKEILAWIFLWYFGIIVFKVIRSETTKRYRIHLQKERFFNLLLRLARDPDVIASGSIKEFCEDALNIFQKTSDQAIQELREHLQDESEEMTAELQ